MKKKMSAKRRRRIAERNRRVGLFICLLLCSFMIILTAGQTIVTANQESYKYYTNITVNSDDTLWTIAEEYYSKEFKDMHKYIKEVCEINDIGYDIYPGQVIIVPYYSSELK